MSPTSNNPRNIALFGSTGSIGKQALEVIRRMGCDRVTVLTGGSQWELLAQQAREYQPSLVVVADVGAYQPLKETLAGTGIQVEAGQESLPEAAGTADYDLCLNGLVGVAGLLPSYEAVRRGKTLALANKESLVLAGDLLNKLAATTGSTILPIDSEHSAVWQCIQGEDIAAIKRLILTASGGPFRDWLIDRIRNATPDDALQHPTWKMGAKITIDSATLMNKGLEVIEAFHLFHLPPEQITVVIHPVSIVHSLVEFCDGSIKAQLGLPDMRLPIQYALTHPERLPAEFTTSDITDWLPLEFRKVEPARYPCLALAQRALKTGGTATAVLNGADEMAVNLFLDRRISFGDISNVIESALDHCQAAPADNLEAILAADADGRRLVQEAVTAVGAA